LITVVQGHHVLLERLVLHAARGLGLDGGRQLVFGAVRRVHGLQVDELVLDQRLGGGQGGGIANLDFNGLPVAADAAVPDVLFPQGQADVAGQGLSSLGERGLHVYLQHEMNAAAQIRPRYIGKAWS
jgi:hypothetical protein